MGLIKTALTFILVGFTMIILIPVGIAVLIFRYTGLGKFAGWLLNKVAKGWAWMLIACTGCRLKITGQEHIPRKGGFCLVSNHGSIFDIVLILAVVDRPVGFIAKKELGYIPFLNFWIPCIGGLYIDRFNIRKALKTINRGIAHIKSGGGMIIFPEGTRSKGRGLLPFRPGSLKLSTKSGAPIVPMAITGSYDVFEKTGVMRPADVTVTIAAPISTAEFSPADQKNVLPDMVYGIIDEAIRKATLSQ
jgi:1-acyl-sn-glycerol-3-phosphate acyltransferase